MAYADVKAVEERLALATGGEFTSSSAPTVAQVSEMLEDVEGEVNSCLSSRSYITPVAQTETAHDFIRFLRGLVVDGVIPRILPHLYPAGVPGHLDPDTFYQRFQDGKAAILDGTVIPDTLPSTGSETDAPSSLSDPLTDEPRFTMNREF